MADPWEILISLAGIGIFIAAGILIGRWKHKKEEKRIVKCRRQPTQSKTEKRLAEAFHKLNVFPKEQYKISNMHVDFAFPSCKVVVEIDGVSHDLEEQRLRDKRRYMVLRGMGWSVWRYRAKNVHENPEKIAKRIIKRIEARNLS